MADTTRLTIELEVILRRLNQTLRGLDQVKRKLESIASIRIGGQPIDKAALAAQRLSNAQQRLIIQSQELANRQERARQVSERLALSQQRLTQAQQRVTATSQRQADAHVKFFRAVQKSAIDADNHVRFFRANEAALRKAPPVDAHVRAFRAIQRSAQQADAHVKAFRANEAFLRKSPQLDAHVQAFRAMEINARRSAQELERARRAAERLAKSGFNLGKLQQGLNSVGAAALRVGGGLRSVGASAAILVTGPLVALGTIAARSAADIDAIRNRLIATEGSLEAANRRIEELRRLADESLGVTRRAALDAFATLSVVGNVTEETINRQIKAMGRLNAAFTIDDQQQFFRNLLQIFTQGFERADIKEALGRVPIFEQLLQQAFGTADRERLRELKASGKLTLDTFLNGLAEAVNTDPLLGQIGESIRVRFQKTLERLSDALEPLGRAILGPLERIILAIEPIVLRIAAAFERLPQGVQTGIVAIGLLVAAAGPLLFILGGISSGIGALATALAAIIPILSSIGLPAILAILGGLTIVVGEITAAVAVLAVAWQKNFLGIRQLVSGAASAIIAAFNRIRDILNDATRRILPTLQSITAKVLGGVTALWERYGTAVVAVVRDSFAFVTGVIETFLKVFTNFVDLILKLVDGDWRGAWRAFARILVTAIDAIEPLVSRLLQIVKRGLATLLVFIVEQALKFSQSGQLLAARFVVALATRIRGSGPLIAGAISDMFLAAVLSVNFATVAARAVARFIAAVRQAAAEGEPTVGAEMVLPESLRPGSAVPKPPRRLGLTTETEDDPRGAKALRDQLKKLQEAQDKFREIQEEGQLELLRSRIETEFTTTKAGLDRQLQLLEQSFDDRLTALKTYLEQRRDLEERRVDAEIARELELTSTLFQELSQRRRIAERELRTDLDVIDRDPRLRGEAREAAIRAARLKAAIELEKAQTEFKIKQEESTARVTQLEKERKQLGEDLVRFDRLITEELGKQQDQLRFNLLEQQGRTADAEAGRLRARFRETLKDLRVDVSGLGVDLQRAIDEVDLDALQARLNELPAPVQTMVELLDIAIKRAQIAELAQFVDDLSAGLRLDEFRIQNKVLDGLISQREAQAQIVQKQREYKGVLLDVLKGELAKAEAIKDQALILALQQQIAETERLGIAIDEAGQRINQALFSDLQSGLAGIFSGARQGFEGLRDAAISFGERLLDTLNDIAATSILERIEGLFKPDATNTEGTIGGFISKLFGLQPKQAADATVAATTLQTGAVSAAGTLTTGATAAGTSFGTIVTTAGASFASLVIGAASALAAALGVSGAAQGAGGLGAALGGAAETGLFPAVPGGLYKFVEGGYPEAVLTTDPKHAARQAAILRAFLRETRGLGGRIKSFAAGAFLSPHEAQSMMLSGLSGPPSVASASVGEMAIAGTPSTMRLRQVLVSENQLPDWVNSSEGEQVLVDFLYRKGHIIRNIGGKR